ncbi:13786_t:CDS:2, partial [Acaulospora colombiana]
EKGVGSTFTPSSTSREQSYIDNNRVEVLRLLLILLSKQIYSSPSSILQNPSKYTHYLVQKVSRKSVLTVLCSLINVIANFSSAPPPGTPTGGIGAGIAGVGKGISKGLNQLPYTQVWKGEDSREMLVCTAAQVLVVVLDYQSGNARDIQSASSNTAEPYSPAPIAGAAHPNLDLPYGQNVPTTPSAPTRPGAPSPKTHHFRYFLAKIHRPADMTYLLDGILGVLGEEIRKGGSLLGIGLGALQGVGVKAAGPKSPGCAQEVLLILWKLLEVNKKFRTHVMEGDRAMDVMACILAYGLELKDKPKSNGACRCLSYMLQFLSAEPGFGPQLSTVPIRIALPTKWNVSIHAIISAGSATSTGETAQNPLNNFSTSYPAFIISLANAAPYLKNISISSSNKLMELFTAFSDPRLLLADEGNPRLTRADSKTDINDRLDAFNSIILRHPSQNPHLLYAMLRSHVLFEDLGTFNLARGLRDIKRREEEERNKSLTSPTHAKGKSPTRGEDTTGQQAHEEKARLLAAEGIEPHSMGGDIDRNGIDASLGSMRISSPPPTSSSSWEGEGAAGTSDDVSHISEKARGKMRQRNESLDVTAELAAAAQIGRNGFIPTQEWVTSWQQGLPLDPILLAISELLPKVQQIQSSMSRTTASPAVMDFLKVVDLKAVLPQRQIVTPRPFIWTDSPMEWNERPPVLCQACATSRPPDNRYRLQCCGGHTGSE